MGLNVFSRPARGTRQDGVDVAAVGSLDGGPQRVYLFSIKPVVICICVGGDIQEQLRPQVKGFIDQAEEKYPGVTFEEWNGDRLADLIQEHFLREDLLPDHARSRLRKALAMLLLSTDTAYHSFIKDWLTELTKRCRFAYRTHGDYPCVLGAYDELLEHPKKGDDAYRQNVTSGSVLYPMISLWAALFDADELYREIVSTPESPFFRP